MLIFILHQDDFLPPPAWFIKLLGLLAIAVRQSVFSDFSFPSPPREIQSQSGASRAELKIWPELTECNDGELEPSGTMTLSQSAKYRAGLPGSTDTDWLWNINKDPPRITESDYTFYISFAFILSDPRHQQMVRSGNVLITPRPLD